MDGQKRFISITLCMEFHVSLNSRSTKLVNCGVDRELSDISVVLRVNIRVMHFIRVLSFLGVIYKTLFVHNILTR